MNWGFAKTICLLERRKGKSRANSNARHIDEDDNEVVIRDPIGPNIQIASRTGGSAGWVVKQEGEPWFVGKDVANALGFGNASKAVLMGVDDEDKQFAMFEVPDSKMGIRSKLRKQR